MGKVSVFNHITLDGFFAGSNGEIDWFKAIKPDDEWEKYTHKQSEAGDTLLFGHTTYEMMKSYWPTPDAIRNDPAMAQVMNNSRKLVISKALKTVEEIPNWKNISLLHEINPEEFLKLKRDANITILGSGSIIQQLANLDLIDEYLLAIVPIILGKGKSLFSNIKEKNLLLTESIAFKNGIVLLLYKADK